jgi:hypothetical protein
MLTVIQSRTWQGFQQSLHRILHIPTSAHLVATPPTLTFSTLEQTLLHEAGDKLCIQTNTHAPHETYAIAHRYGQRLLCGTYLIHLQTQQIIPTNLVEEDGSPTIYLR